MADTRTEIREVTLCENPFSFLHEQNQGKNQRHHNGQDKEAIIEREHGDRGRNAARAVDKSGEKGRISH